MKVLKIILNILISLVWLINGLFCKIFDLVPRHQLIVARILGEDHSFLFTKVIGSMEVLMFIWIISRIKSRWCTIAQIILVGTMNTIEFIVAPDLLLFGHVNLIFAICFMFVLLLNEFWLNKNKSSKT